MKFIRNIIKILIASGFAIESKKLLFLFNYTFLTSILRLKISPEILLNNNFNPDDFLNIISKISIGPAYKTTLAQRHPLSNALIIKKMKELERGIFVDIGASDGSSSLDLIKKAREYNINFKLYDKHNFLVINRTWFGWICSNIDKDIVYIKIFIFLFFIYPFKIKTAKQQGKKIYFNNPRLANYKKKVEYFDIFRTNLNQSFALVKCANILTSNYYNYNKIKLGLANLYKNLATNGFLFLIHNKKEKENFIILQKTTKGFLIIENRDSEFCNYCGFQKEINII